MPHRTARPRLIPASQGAINTTLWLNDKPVCTLYPLYGRKRTSVDSFGTKHISDNKICANIGPIAKNDEMRLTSFYDFDQHPWDATLDRSTTEAIMAINNVSAKNLMAYAYRMNC